jgi:hypothetical protein
MQADMDVSGLGFPARFAVVGDFDGDGRAELAIAPEVAGSAANDFWVMKYDVAQRRWLHLSPMSGHSMQADMDASGLTIPARFAVVGDFDGDGRAELAIAPEVAGSAANDFWVMKYQLPTEMGQWALLPRDAEILAVHAAMLPTGKVLYFAGGEHDRNQTETGQVDHTRLWDPTTDEIQSVGSPPYDLFCSGHAFLADGRLLAAGGTSAWPGPGEDHHTGHFRGVRDAVGFNPGFAPGTNPWSTLSPMVPQPGRTEGGGRWYPTLVTLPDGRVLAMSGHPVGSDLRHNNTSLEIFDPSAGPAGTWSYEGEQLAAPDGYPRLHVLPDGHVFCVVLMNGRSSKWNPGTKAWTDLPGGPGTEHLDYNLSSVLLPLLPSNNYTARVLVTGMPQPQLINLSSPNPAWQPTAARALSSSQQRLFAFPVLLPDGNVLVVGGATTNQDASAVHDAELYDPRTGQWSVLEKASVPRLYHSVALLLPDGRVWTAGSNFNCAPGVENRELRMEVYSPPYLFRGHRPVLQEAPRSVSPASQMVLSTPNADDIASVAFIRSGSATHAFDADQRHIGLAIEGRSPGQLTVRAPPDHNIAPPGWYMLFLVNRRGVPSIASFVQLV